MTRIDSSNAAQEAHEAAAEAAEKAQENTQASTRHSHTQHASQLKSAKLIAQHAQQRLRLSRSEQGIAFFHNKMFAAKQSGKAPQSTTQKLLSKLGTRPPVPGKKHAQQKAHNSAHRPEHETAHTHPEHEQTHSREHPQEKHDQQGKQAPKKPPLPGEQPQQKQGQQGQQQTPDQQQAQDQQKERKPAQGDDRLAAGKIAGKRTGFASSLSPAIAAQPLPEKLQLLAAAMQDRVRELPQRLAAEYTKHILELAKKVEFGYAIAPLMVLNLMSPTVPKRSVSRINAQRAGAMENAKTGSTTASMLGHTLDATVARKRFAIGYSHETQSLQVVKQLLLDAKPASNKTNDASQMTPEVRINAVTPKLKP